MFNNNTNEHDLFRFSIFSEVVGKYTRELRKLSLKLLELICEGLGLNPGYFSGGLSGHPEILVHRYPPCPDPSLTLGIAKHRDYSLITILLQEQHVEGLQVLKDGQWIGVEPIPNAFVVNIGLILQVHLLVFGKMMYFIIFLTFTQYFNLVS